MVVTRRTPVVPPAPVSRSQSSQGMPRPARPSLTQEPTSAQRTTSPLASDEAQLPATTAEPVNGSSGPSPSEKRPQEDEIPKKKSKKQKPAKSKRRKTKNNFQAFLDFLTKLLLFAFTIYTFSVCSQDTRHQSPICRGLTEYKRIVLDPYILPPLQAIAVHPYIAPQIERTKPYVHRAIEATVPVFSRVQTEWNAHVAPRWEKYVVPEWNKRVVPQWHRYVTPRVDVIRDTIEPYHRRVNVAYDQHIAPSARYAIYILQCWQRRAQPYILFAVSKTQQGYYAARPYTVPLIHRAGLAVQQLAMFLQEQRQKFVDPHVAKIWEKVKELSRGKQDVDEPEPRAEVVSPDSAPLAADLPDDTLTSMLTPLASPVHMATSEESDLPPIDVPATFTEHLTPTPSTEEPTHSKAVNSSALTEGPMAPLGGETLPSAESAPAETPQTSAPYPSAAASSTEETKASVAASPSAAPDHSMIFQPEQLERSSRSLLADGDDEIDMDAFYTELGLDDPLGTLSVSQQHMYVPLSQPTETEEEQMERLHLKAEETARRRADIEARHARWEAELQAQMERSTSELQGRLHVLRELAAAELSSSAPVRDAIEELASEAEKYIKGAVIYLKNLKGENGRHEEKLVLWDRVVEKVGDKFVERLYTTQAVVTGQYNSVLSQEMQEVTVAIAKVREVAEKGQVDLGLDYAWLDDVTYGDWQRYHRLIEVSDQYAQEAVALQNGTHASVTVENPLTPIVKDLESELQDIIVGFETRLRRIKRDGERAFHNNGVPSEKGPASEPEVSILPLPGAGSADKAHAFVPPVIIGRCQQEVLDTLDRVEEVGRDRGSEEARSTEKL